MDTSFNEAIGKALGQLRDEGQHVANARWQSVEVAPERQTIELLNHTLQVDTHGVEDLDVYRNDIRPNLPWADEHFLEERVSGEPVNPGETYLKWFSGSSADRFRTVSGPIWQFSHSYAERYWPKYANRTPGGRLGRGGYSPRFGIRYQYGDLEDLVHVLLQDPTTRQAYLPVWFPEDLYAARKNERVPCSLGYHFIVRNDRLHCSYYLRSCDAIRHFRDDIYLSMRLLLWILGELRLREPLFEAAGWEDIIPGIFTMHIVSFHCFVADYKPVFGREYERHE